LLRAAFVFVSLNNPLTLLGSLPSSSLLVVGWSIWSTTSPNVDHVVYGEYHNTGPGSHTSQRANFTTLLTSTQRREYGIAEVLGSDWREWVDGAYY
jgi:pectinesterase